MDIQIDLQRKTSALPGIIDMYWHENKRVGLERTLYHRFSIPLKPFDSGLEYDPQPMKTLILVDWIKLELQDPTQLDGLTLSSAANERVETSIYLGSAYNNCNIKRLNLKGMGTDIYCVDCDLFVDFAYEMVANPEDFSFATELKLDRNIRPRPDQIPIRTYEDIRKQL